MVKKRLLLIVSLLFIASVCFGQTGTTGVINGTVTDPDGVALPGITVILKSPALVLPQLTTVTNASGVYRFMGLAPGTYELTFELEGMNTLVRKGIVVGAGKTSTVDVGMTLKSLEESIIVSGKAPTIDRQKPTRAATLDLEFLKYIPSTRTMRDYFNMAPGVTGDTAAGACVRDNSYNLDGVNMNDPVVGTQFVTYGMDIMEEMSVTTGGVTAEYGAVRGAVVNVVTKSGGNEFHGQGIFFYRDLKLQSKNTEGTVLEGFESGFDYEIEPGFSLGGPIIKDKLWFFGNFAWNKSSEFRSNFPYDKDEQTPIVETNPYPFFKLTFQPSKKDKFIASINYSGRRVNHRHSVGTWARNNEDSTWHQKTRTSVYNLHWTRFWGNNLVTNAKFGYVDFNMDLLSNVQDVQYYWAWEGALFSNGGGHDDLNPRTRLQFNVDGTTFIDNLAGSHELKFGGEFTKSDSKRGWVSWGDSVPGLLDTNIYRNYQHSAIGTVYEVFQSDYMSTDRLLNTSFFIQDTWVIGKRLTLNVGGRLEMQKGVIPKQNADATPYTYMGYLIDTSEPESRTVLEWTTLCPRLGLTFDVFADGSTLIKSTYGRYYSANITQWFGPANRNQGVWGYFRYGSLVTITLPGDFNIGWTDPNTGKEYKMRNPYVDEFTIGIERELWEDWSIGLRYIDRKDRDLIDDADACHLDMYELMENGNLIWTNFTPVTVTDPYDGSTQTFYDQNGFAGHDFFLVNGPHLYRNYKGIELTVNKRYSKGWSINASYTWNKSTGVVGTDFYDSYGYTSYYDNPNYHYNKQGRMELERRHQVKIQGLFKGPWGINLGWYYYYLSGRRDTRQIRSDDFGLNLYQGNVTINAEPKGSTARPDLHALDLKVEKAFKIGNVTLAVFMDIFNVFNQGVLTDQETVSSDPTRTFGEMITITDPRIIRLGAKIEF